MAGASLGFVPGQFLMAIEAEVRAHRSPEAARLTMNVVVAVK